MEPVIDTIRQLSTDVIKAVDIQTPSINRPFGIHLYPIFDVFWTRVLGYSARDFTFKYGETPIGTLKESASLIIAYYLIIFGGREIMRNFEPFKLRLLFQAHNLILTIISFVLLVLFLEDLIPTVYNHGLLYGICDYNGGWSPLIALYYVSI